MSILKIEVARKFVPLLGPGRDKAAFGGRGSGKSHFFAGLLVEDSLAEPSISGEGMRAICIREVQRDLTQSVKHLIEDKLSRHRLGEADGFKVFRDVIKTPKDGAIIFKGMQDYTADSIKSLENFKRAWWEEAQGATQHSVNLLRPTIRAPGSQLWWSWNPRRKSDPVDAMFRGAEKPSDSIVVETNWRDNPWWTPELESERKDTLRLQPEQYDHIWEGGYAKALAGAYFARQLAEAKAEGRITRLKADPLLPVYAVFDLGGAGASADAMAIWIVQYFAHEIRFLDYLEGVGQVLAYYVNELRARGWARAVCITPHDGVNTNAITGKRYVDHLRDAEFEAEEPVKNQGKGAAALRIEAARRLFPQILFNESTTEAGRDALGFYHEKKDDVRNVGLGPDHDWSSHCADAFGLACIYAEQVSRVRQREANRPRVREWQPYDSGMGLLG